MILRKILIGLGIILALLIVALIAFPLLFKDDIKQRVQQEIANAINADVEFDPADIDLTLFENFPDMTVELPDLSVFNRAPFEGTRLFYMRRLSLEVNLYDLVFGDRIEVQGIVLSGPEINIKVLKDGTANYDITYPDTSIQETAPSSPFDLRINHWQISDGNILYEDASLPLQMSVRGLNHRGEGNFNATAFDLITRTSLDNLSATFDSVTYLNNKRLNMDMELMVSEDYTLYTFNENTIKLNDFELALEGWFKMGQNDYDMDIRYKTKKNTFKTLLSLVPGIYTEKFKDLKTRGELAFFGFFKGVYNDQQIPTFNLTAKVSDGMFQYPELPSAVENVNIDMQVDNRDGVLENTRIDLKKIHFNVGKNPFDINMIIENLHNYAINGTIKARMNLEDIQNIFPMEELALKGSFFINSRVKGVYDSTKNIIPAVDMTMALHDGYVKSKAFPIPMEKVNFDATVKNASGNMAETRAEIENLSIMIDNEQFLAHAVVTNLNDYTWDADMRGTIDLEKITKIFTLENTQLMGKMNADIQTRGKMSDITEKRYGQIATKGVASLEKFKYTSQDLPYDVTIDKARIEFDPRMISLKNMVATVGKSDFRASGSLSNYMAYLFNENQTINGTVKLVSNTLDINEFMDSENQTAPDDEETYGVIPIPKHINATLIASAQNVVMMDYKMSNASGTVNIKNETAYLRGLTFDLLGGKFDMEGSYATKNQKHPDYNMKLNIQHMDIAQAFKSFSIVRTYAPIAGLAKGRFDTNFKIQGKLLPTMEPDMATVNGSGLVNITNMGIKDSKVIAGITALTKLTDSDEVTLRNASIPVTIQNGRLRTDPFDMQFAGYDANAGGSIGMDGTLDYLFTVKVPIEKLGNIQGFVQQNVGNAVSEIPVTIGIENTYQKPKFKLDTEQQKKELQKIAAKVAKEKGGQIIQKALKSEEARKLINNLLNPGDNRETPQQQPGKSPPSTPKKQKNEPVEQLIQQGLKNLFKKKDG